MIHYVVVELKNDHQSEKYISRKSRRPVNQRLKLTLFMVQPAIFTHPLDFSDIHRTDLCFIQLFYCNCLSVQIGLWMNDRIFWCIFLNEWLAFKCLQSQKSTKTLCWAGKCRVLIVIINTFCCFHQTKNGFPLLNSTWRTYKKVPFRVQTKTERVSIRERNAELCV